MSRPAKLVSVYISEGDEWHRRPLHTALLQLLHDRGIAGGTVLRAVAGFTGAGDDVHTTSLVDVGHHLPLVVQFIDTEERVSAVLDDVRERAGARLVTVADVTIAD